MRRARETRWIHTGAALAVAALIASPFGTARAQDDDVPRPPRLDRAAEANRPREPAATPRGELLSEPKPRDLEQAEAQPPPSTLNTQSRPPNAARLAPLREERRTENGIDEIIVLGGNWRLPDLGSRWRARQQAAEEAGVPHLTLLPLYDPERPTTFNNTFLLNREFARVGYIDLFRVRFGRRSKSDDDE